MRRCGLFLLLLIPLLLLACSRKFQPTGPSSPDFRYPLRAGMQWVYDRQISTINNSDAINADAQTSRITVQVIGAENIFDTEAVKVRENIDAGGVTGINYQYYDNREDGLYLLGSLGKAVALPKSSALTSPEGILRLSLWGFATPFPASDSIYQKIPPKPALKYPLTPGAQWRFREQGQPRRIDKKVIAEMTIETPAGSFHVIQLQWLLDFDGDGLFDDNVEFYDYIATSGLVKRSFLIKNLPLVDDSGHNIGSYNYLDETNLISSAP